MGQAEEDRENAGVAREEQHREDDNKFKELQNEDDYEMETMSDIDNNRNEEIRSHFGSSPLAGIVY